MEKGMLGVSTTRRPNNWYKVEIRWGTDRQGKRTNNDKYLPDLIELKLWGGRKQRKKISLNQQFPKRQRFEEDSSKFGAVTQILNASFVINWNNWQYKFKEKFDSRLIRLDWSERYRKIHRTVQCTSAQTVQSETSNNLTEWNFEFVSHRFHCPNLLSKAQSPLSRVTERIFT